MAVLNAVPGIEVSISINDQTVQEYDTDDDINGPLASVTVVKYIEAVSDAEFAINASVLPSYETNNRNNHDIRFRTFVDGKYCQGACVYLAHGATQRIKIDGWKGVNEHGNNVTRSFKFSAVKTVEVIDGKMIETDAETAKYLGELIVDVLRCKGRVEVKTEAKKLFEGPVSEIAEKDVKGRALSHETIFGRERKTPPQKFAEYNYLDGKDKPILRFIFRYRSKEALRKLWIISRSPSPDPFEALSAADKERLAREAFGRQQGTKPEPLIKSELSIKRERSQSAVDLTEDAPRIKLKKSSMINPIDLTDD